MRTIKDFILYIINNGFYASLIASLVAMVLAIIAILGDNEKTRVKLFIGAFACMAEASFASIVIDFANDSPDGGFSISSLGIFGFQMFMLAENIITDFHIDNGDKKFRKYRILPLVSSIAISALLAWTLYPSGENAIVAAILSCPYIPTFYFCTKHLIFPEKQPKPKSFIMHFVPFELAFYLADLLSYAFWYHGYYTLSSVMSTVEAVPLIAMGVVIFKEFRRGGE